MSSLFAYCGLMSNWSGLTEAMARRAFRRLPRGLRASVRAAVAGRPFLTPSPHLLVAITMAFGRLAAGGAGAGAGAGRAYYEFGVYRGYSLWYAEQMSRLHADPGFRCLGFDSFAGLPASVADRRYYRRGEFSASKAEVTGNLTRFGARLDKIELFEGFYSAGHFAELARRHGPFPDAAICVIDVDIYESCREVLEFMRTRLPAGSLLIFDDFNDMAASDDHGERRALREFQQRYPGFRLSSPVEVGPECVLFEVLAAA